MPSGFPGSPGSPTENSHGAGKCSEEDEEEGGETTCRKLRDFFCQNSTFFIQKLIGPLQQTGNPGDRKFDKKLLKFSFFVLFTLFTSCHFQTVFFSYNCLILPFSITWKIYSSRPVSEFNFKEKKEIPH